MQVLKSNEFSTRIAASFLFLLVLLQLAPVLVQAQNLGGAPATNKAVQGQTAAQPEGAFLNLVIRSPTWTALSRHSLASEKP